jgi:hypothetical protein
MNKNNNINDLFSNLNIKLVKVFPVIYDFVLKEVKNLIDLLIHFIYFCYNLCYELFT